MSILPKPSAVLNQALLTVAGAVLAAFIISQMPSVRDWIKAKWDGSTAYP